MIIHTYRSRRDNRGRAADMSWEALVDRLRRPVVTSEDSDEYRAMSNAEKTEAKDVGGFVGGAMLNDRPRGKDSVLNRTVLTLDADEAGPDDWENFHCLYCAGDGSPYNACVYPTHSYTPEAPCLRWLFPLSRPVSPEEYRQIARVVIGWVGRDSIDESTDQPERLMFWPSVPHDVDYESVFRAITDGADLDADALLQLSAEAGTKINKNAPMSGRSGAGGSSRQSGAYATRVSESGEVEPISELHAVAEGGRDNFLTREAGLLRQRGYGYDAMLGALTAINLAVCQPPVEEEDLKRICRSVCRYSPGDGALRAATLAGSMTGIGDADLGLVHTGSIADIEAQIELFGPGDSAIARAVAKNYGNQFLYCDALGMLRWNGQRYEPGQYYAETALMQWVSACREEGRKLRRQEELEIRRAEDFCEPDKAEIAKLRLDGIDAMMKLIGAYAGRTKRDAVMKDWRALIATDVAVLDADPYALNTPAGLVDLRNGKVRATTPADRVTKITLNAPLNHNPWMTRVVLDELDELSDDVIDERELRACKLWQDFLRNVTGGDKELEEMLRLVCGLSLIGEVKVEGLFFIYGPGGTGKSTFTNTIMEVLGDYAGMMFSKTLMNDRNGNYNADIAELRGVRFVLAAELNQNDRLAEDQVKKLTSTDYIRGEKKYQAPFLFKPSHTLFIPTNYQPSVQGRDTGTWRRINVLPFTVVRTGKDDEELDYKSVLVREAGGAVLSWMISGAVDIIRARFKLPRYDRVLAEVREYKADEDNLQLFIDSECIADKEGRFPKGELTAAYNRWARLMGLHSETPQTMTRWMRDKGYAEVIVRGTRKWVGLRLKGDFEEAEE